MNEPGFSFARSLGLQEPIISKEVEQCGELNMSRTGMSKESYAGHSGSSKASAQSK